MREWLKKLPYKKKIFFSYLLLVTFFAAGAFFYVAQQFSERTQRNMEYMSQSNSQLQLALEMIEENADRLKYLHFSDEEMYSILVRKRENFTERELLEADAYMQKCLSYETDLDNYILRATVKTSDGRVYQSLVGEQENYLRRMERMTRDIEWTDKNSEFYTGVYSSEINMITYSLVTIITPIYDITDDEPLGMLYIDWDFGRLRKRLDTIQKSEMPASQFAILNEKEVLYHSADTGKESYPVSLDDADLYEKLKALAESGQTGTRMKMGDRNCSVSAAYDEKSGWIFLQYEESSALIGEILPDIAKLACLSLLVLTIMFGISIYFADNVSKPVQLLSSVIGQVGRKSNQEITLIDESENIWEDEMGMLITNYNAMAQRINENIIQSYVAELNQKRTELKMLQFQINPHFLYNALNTISSIAILENVEYIPEIANSLSDMFRYNIKGSNIVTVGEELVQLKNYMNIQNIRFPDRFHVETDIPEEILGCSIIKFVLQPIVENSIHHGFVRKREKDRLKISARLDEGVLTLIVEDDGVGIDPKQVQEMNERFVREDTAIELGEDAKSIGLANVNARLRNYYRGEGGIQVESCLGEYTRIILKIHEEQRKEG